MGQEVCGFVRHDRVALLCEPSGAARTADQRGFATVAGRLVLHGDGFDARSAALDGAARRLRSLGLLGPERGEHYAVARAAGAPARCRIDRSAVTFFGVRPVGVHLTAFVRRGGELLAWVAVRARGKPTFPGRWDNSVAGGQPIGLSLRENLVKECAEEASLPPALAERAEAAGTVSYLGLDARDGGLKPDTLFCFDLELPGDVVLRPGDDEVERFELLPVREIAAVVRDTTLVKPNCNLVWIDFFLRHGVLDAELSPRERADLARALRRPLP